MSRAPSAALLAAAVVAAFGGGACGGAGGAGGGGAQPASVRAWKALAPATLERTEVAAARVGRFVYVMGGFEQRSGATVAVTERYDIRHDRWRRVADMPAGLNHAAAVAYDGDVYVVGGYRGRNTLDDEVATLYRYRPERNRWTRLPSAPTRRGALAAGVIGHRLYAVGGAASGRGALPTLEIYDFRSRRWSAGPDLPLAREHLAAAVARGRFYALAGRAAGQGNFRRVDRYDPARRCVDARARHAQGARRDRRRHGRRAHRGVRGRGGCGHDPPGRALRPGRGPLALAAGDAHAAARPRRRVQGPPHLRDRGWRPAGLPLHPGDRVPRSTRLI